MGILTKIEDIVSIPLELFHNQKGFHPVDLNRLAQRCMERGCRKGISRTYAPNQFTILFNPEDYQELYPFLETIRADVIGDLRCLAEERDYMLVGELIVEITEDSSTIKGLPKVKGHMQGDKNPGLMLSVSEKESRFEEYEKTFGRDDETVVLLKELKCTTEEKMMEGETVIEEGASKGIQKEIKRAKDSLKSLKQHQLTMAVVLDMMNNRVKAFENCFHFEPVNNSPPESKSRFELSKGSKLPSFPQEWTAFTLGHHKKITPDLALHLRSDGVFIENKNLDSMVLINGQPVQKMLLKDGDCLRIGDLEIRYYADYGEK